jgi:hypothetical protein
MARLAAFPVASLLDAFNSTIVAMLISPEQQKGPCSGPQLKKGLPLAENA